MSRAIQGPTACREALARLPELNLGELRQQWRVLYKTEASPHLSRELLLRAVAYRMQELALGGLRRCSRAAFLTGAIGRRHSQRGRPLGHDSSRGANSTGAAVAVAPSRPRRYANRGLWPAWLRQEY